MVRSMLTGVTIFLSAVLAALIQGVYKAVTGKDLFPANPKGPLYKWLGKPKEPTHESPQEPQPPPRRVLLRGRLSELPDQPRAPRFRVLGGRRR
jgi:hypothetical protein